MMLQEMSEQWHKENEKSLIPVFWSLCNRSFKNRTGSVDFDSFDLQKKQGYREKGGSFLNRMRPRKFIFDDYCGFGGMKRR